MEIILLLIIGILIIVGILWKMGTKVHGTFNNAIENAQSRFLYNPKEILLPLYNNPKHPRYSELKSIGIDFIL